MQVLINNLEKLLTEVSKLKKTEAAHRLEAKLRGALEYAKLVEPAAEAPKLKFPTPKKET